MEINETKHETYGALGIAGILSGMLSAELDSNRFVAILIAIVVLVVFAGLQRLLIKKWKLQYGEGSKPEPLETAAVALESGIRTPESE